MSLAISQVLDAVEYMAQSSRSVKRLQYLRLGAKNPMRLRELELSEQRLP